MENFYKNIDKKKLKTIEKNILEKYESPNFKDNYLYFYLYSLKNINYPIKLMEFFQKLEINYKTPYYFIANEWNGNVSKFDNFTVVYALPFLNNPEKELRCKFENENVKISICIRKTSYYPEYKILTGNFGDFYSLEIEINIISGGVEINKFSDKHYSLDEF